MFRAVPQQKRTGRHLPETDYPLQRMDGHAQPDRILDLDGQAFAVLEKIRSLRGHIERIEVTFHEAQILVAVLCGQGRGGKIPFQQLEGGRKLATAEVGLVEALALFGPALEHLLVLGGIVFAADDVEVGLYAVDDVAQHQRSPLLPIVFDKDRRRGAAVHEKLQSSFRQGAQKIAAVGLLHQLDS